MKIHIVGAGQVGYFLCDRLSREVTLIDQDEEKIERAQDRLNVLGITGNGASADILEQTGIKDTDIFIAVTNMDEVNILAYLLAKQHPSSRNLALVSQPELLGLASDLGIDACVSPRLVASL